MNNLIRYPLSIFVLSFFAMWLAAQIGDFLRERRKILDQEEQQEHDFIVTTTLTLLALIIGFTFSMAIGRYDLRKNYEEAEANAIGTDMYGRGYYLPIMQRKCDTPRRGIIRVVPQNLISLTESLHGQ
jgi:hypothetical protein